MKKQPKRRARGGRPALPEADRYSCRRVVLLRPATDAALEAAAEAAGVTVPEHMRRIVEQAVEGVDAPPTPR